MMSALRLQIRPGWAVLPGPPSKKGYASRMEGYACVCARIRHPCRMGAYAPVRGEGARTGPSWPEFAPKDWKPAQISNHASIMRPMRMRPTRIRHPQRMAEIRMALLSPTLLPPHPTPTLVRWGNDQLNVVRWRRSWARWKALNEAVAAVQYPRTAKKLINSGFA